MATYGDDMKPANFFRGFDGKAKRSGQEIGPPSEWHVEYAIWRLELAASQDERTKNGAGSYFESYYLARPETWRHLTHPEGPNAYAGFTIKAYRDFKWRMHALL